MTLLRILAAAALLAAPVPGPAAAQALSVAVPHDPPYAVHDPSGVTTGLAVDLARLAAEAGGIELTLVQVAGDARGGLAGHDVVLPVAAAADLEIGADLTAPFHTATLGVARAGGGLWDVVAGLLTLDVLRVVASLAALLLVVGAAVWALERRRNGDMFAPVPVRGLGDGFWWAGVTLTTIGYGDKAPVTLAGRAVAMVWMLAGLAVSASLTAAIVSAVGAGRGPPDLPEALAGERVAVVDGGPAARFVEGRNVVPVAVADLDAALAAVADGRADAALGAAPALRWARAAGGHAVEVETTAWEPVLKVAAFREGDDRREAFDRALLGVLASEAGQEVVRRYLGE